MSKKKKKDSLRLMDWSNDNYPPLDLNASIADVIALIEEVKKLRKKVASIEKTVEPSFKMMVEVWCNEYPLLGFNGASGKSMNEIIKNTRMILKSRGKEDTVDAVVNAFKYVIDYVKRERHFCNGKPLTTWNNQYLSIINEIASGRRLSKPLTTREKINQL